MTNEDGRAKSLLYQCVIVQPTEVQFQVGAPVEAERSWNKPMPYLLVQGVVGRSVTYSDSVENFRSNVSSILERLLKAQGSRISLQDIGQGLVNEGYEVRHLPTKHQGISPKTL